MKKMVTSVEKRPNAKEDPNILPNQLTQMSIANMEALLNQMFKRNLVKLKAYKIGQNLQVNFKNWKLKI